MAKLMRLIILIIMVFMIVGCKKKENPIGEYDIIHKSKWTQVGTDIVVFKTSFYDVNATLIKTTEGAVLIDTGTYPDDAKVIEKYIKDKKIELKKIIITHNHGDHNRNLYTFKEDDMDVIEPSNANEGQLIEIGDKKLKVIFTEGHYGPKGHISVIVNDHILVAGDVVCNSILPPVASGGNINELLETLNKIKNANYDVIIPGHGDVIPTEDIMNIQFEYLINAKTKVEEIITNNGTEDDLKNIKLGDCLEDTSNLYPEQLNYWHLENLKTIYRQLNEEN